MNTISYRGKHKVLNPKTGRYVNRTGAIGKTIKKSKCSYLSARKKPSCKNKLKLTTKRPVKKSTTKKTVKKSTTKKTVKKSTTKKTVKKSTIKKTVKKSTTKKPIQKYSKAYVSVSGKRYSKCWPGYKQVGWKMKNGRRVPNCIKI